MSIQEVLSLCLFVLFVITVLIRAAILRKRGIQAIVFGKTDKSDFIIIPVVAVVVYAVLASMFELPIWEVLIRPFGGNLISGWMGIVLCSVALVGFILSMYNFGDSFRVGIDEHTPNMLITSGVFAFSRNPIYVCFLIFVAGLFLIHRNIVIAVATLFFALIIHRQILREERFLKAHYGEEYAAYCKKVRRYL